MVRNPPAIQETRVWSLGREDPWRRAWQPTPVFLPGESPGQRSLADYGLWGCKESDMTESLTHTQPARNYCIAQGALFNAVGSLDGRGVWGRIDTRVSTAESLCCPPETTTALLIGYTPIQNKKLKKPQVKEMCVCGSRWPSWMLLTIRLNILEPL